MKISEGGRGRGVLLKEWTTHSLSRGLVMFVCSGFGCRRLGSGAWKRWVC